jgi:hypothetical protein
MSLVLSGSDGLSDVDGSAATPAIRGTDANTGIFFPAADTIAFAEGGAEVMRIDSNGNVGIGTTSPQTTLNLGGATNKSFSTNTATGNRAFFSGWQDVAIVGVNRNPANGTFTDAGKAAASVNLSATNGDSFISFDTTGSNNTTPTERVRINQAGSFIVGKTLADVSGGVGFFVTNAGSVFSVITTGGNTNHVYSSSSSSYRFYVAENGGVYNFSGNNVNLSDERTKTNIEVAGGYLDKICAIPVKLFNYKDEAEGEQRTLGVIAQDVEAVAPEFVNNDGWEGATAEDGSPLKTVYSNDMMFALMKCIQEQQAIITALTARVEALEGTQP